MTFKEGRQSLNTCREGKLLACFFNRLCYLLLEFSQMVRQAAFLQRSDPLDVSKVQAPDTQMNIIINIIYITVKLWNAFTSDSELQ